MAVNEKYVYVWHVGETASPFSCQVVDSLGDGRTDIASALFSLINRDTGAVLIGAQPCQSVAGGQLSYTPTAAEMQTPCRFRAQFVATTSIGAVLPTIHIDGEIEGNVTGTGGGGSGGSGNAPALHAETHEAGNSDEINVDGLFGVLADAQAADTLVLPGPVSVPFGAVAERQVLALVGGEIVGITALPFSVSGDIAPLHWWRANAVTESDGFVDSLDDQGSLPINLAQTGAARAPLALDVDDKAYLALDQAASCFYTAGAAPDWNFLHDGSPYTIALVYQRTDPISDDEVILDTANMNQANAGCSLFLDFNSAKVQGPKFVLAATGGPNIPISLVSRVPKTDKECVVIRHYGSNTTVETGSHTPNAIDAIMRRNGVLVSTAAKSSVVYSNEDAFSPLTLGKQSAANAGFTDAHIYELVVDNKTWSDRQIQGYENYARTTYKVSEA